MAKHASRSSSVLPCCKKPSKFAGNCSRRLKTNCWPGHRQGLNGTFFPSTWFFLQSTVKYELTLSFSLTLLDQKIPCSTLYVIYLQQPQLLPVLSSIFRGYVRTLEADFLLIFPDGDVKNCSEEVSVTLTQSVVVCVTRGRDCCICRWVFPWQPPSLHKDELQLLSCLCLTLTQRRDICPPSQRRVTEPLFSWSPGGPGVPGAPANPEGKVQPVRTRPDSACGGFTCPVPGHSRILSSEPKSQQKSCSFGG